jgi:pimeloyl-ACP methyl ester carboxylesterase
MGSPNPWLLPWLPVVVLIVVCACQTSREPWVVGTLSGAQFRISVPRDWNGSLVLAAGGYSPSPFTFRPDQPVPSFPRELLAQGYAYAETGYSQGGLAIAEGVSDVRALRRYFTEEYGRPQRTFVVGESKGGLVALLLMEATPAESDGALAISGLLSSPLGFMKRAFDLLALYERQVPGMLPSVAQIPAGYVANEQMLARVLESLEANPNTASMLRERASVRRNEDLAELLAFHTDALRDLQSRCAGNPFEGEMPVDGAAALPDSQTTGNPKATECARSLPSPTGMLHRPLFAVNVRYDPVIPDWSAQEYLALLESTGKGHLFAHEVVAGEGHLNVRTPDRLRAFSSLVKWSAEGVRPLP